jgi:hypothetical protein
VAYIRADASPSEVLAVDYPDTKCRRPSNRLFCNSSLRHFAMSRLMLLLTAGGCAVRSTLSCAGDGVDHYVRGASDSAESSWTLGQRSRDGVCELGGGLGRKFSRRPASDELLTTSRHRRQVTSGIAKLDSLNHQQDRADDEIPTQRQHAQPSSGRPGDRF